MLLKWRAYRNNIKEAKKKQPHFKLHKFKEEVHRKFPLKENDDFELCVGDNKLLHIRIVDNLIHWEEHIDNVIVSVSNIGISKVQYYIMHHKYEEREPRKFVFKYNDEVELQGNEKISYT